MCIYVVYGLILFYSLRDFTVSPHEHFLLNVVYSF